MIQTAHLLLGKPLNSNLYSHFFVSLDGSRKVRTGQDDNDNQREEVLNLSVLDHYAIRANWQENIPQILTL